MDSAVGGDYEPIIHARRLPDFVGDTPTGFLNDEDPGSHVPRFEPELPVSIEAPGRYPGEVECSSSEPSDTPCYPESISDGCRIRVGAVLAIIRKPRHQEARSEVGPIGHSNRFAVEQRSLVAGRCEDVIAHHVDDDAGQWGFPVPQPDRDCDVWHAGHEVHGAIEWVDDPPSPRPDNVSSAFLSEHCVAGSVGMNDGEYGFFRLTIGGGYGVDHPFHLGVPWCSESVAYDLGAGQGSLNSDFEISW